jgi:type III pantothenate kinase
MNLIIDIGNTFVKLAVFDGDYMLYTQRIEGGQFSSEYLKLKNKYPKLTHAIVSSVGFLKSSELKFITEDLTLIVLNFETKLAFINLYATPKTLGVDRLALVSAAVNKYPNKNVLVIDAGTCITYDFINTEKQYLGGAISPGLRLRYKSLNNLTAHLPLLESVMPETITGNSTEASIHSGVVFGIINEIDGSIQKYQQKYPDLTVILTGGDANFLSNQLKNSIFANSNFLLEGLNAILEYNK